MPHAKRERVEEDSEDDDAEECLAVLRVDRRTHAAMRSLLKMNTTCLQEATTWRETFVESEMGTNEYDEGVMIKSNMTEVATIKAIHLPDVGEVIFSMEAKRSSRMGRSKKSADLCRMGGKSFHRIAFIEGKCLPEQLCYRSIGESTNHSVSEPNEETEIRDPEAIANLRHGMSRLAGNPAKALTDQQLLALLSYLLPTDRPGYDARAIMEGDECKIGEPCWRLKTDEQGLLHNCQPDPVKPIKVVHFTRMRDTTRPKGHKWVTGIVKKLADHYEEHLDLEALLDYTPQWFAELNGKRSK